MKLRRASRLWSGIIVLVLIGACSSSPPSPDSAAGDLNLSEAVRITPKDTQNIFLIDLKGLREDEELENLYDGLIEEFSIFEDGFGVNFLDVSSILTVNADEDSEAVILLHGDIVKLDITDELEDLEFEQDAYREAELWENAARPDTPFFVAFPNTNRVAFGPNRNSVRAVVRASVGDEASLNESKDMKNIIDRLPPGLIYVITSACEEDDPDTIAGVRGCIAQGASGVKIDPITMETTVVTKFESESRAERELESLEAAFEREFGGDNLFNITSEQSGVFATVKGRIDIQDFVQDFLDGIDGI